jgi:dihydropyrimidinase
MPRPRTIRILNGTLVTETGTERTDLLVEGERVARWGDLSAAAADATYDARGLLVLPGAVDPHVHFNDEFMGTVSVHDYARGTLAAAHGGVTTVIDFSNQTPGGSLLETLVRKTEEARGRALVDWGVHPVITSPSPAVLDEIPRLVEAGAPTIKCYMTYRSEGLMVGDPDLEAIARRLARAGGMLMLHAEDNDLVESGIAGMIGSGRVAPAHHAQARPPEAEERAVRRAVAVARASGGRVFIVHLASDRALAVVAAARREGLRVFAETCTHYLAFTESMLEREDGLKWICSPPLRSPAIREELWRGLADGRIALVSSDDAAYSWEAKLWGRERFDLCPNGIPGVEVRLPVLHSKGVVRGRISLPRFVELVAAAPADLFGLGDRKGRLRPGYDADIVLFDPCREWVLGRDTLHMAADWSAYEGLAVTGSVETVFSRGECVIDRGRCVAEAGRGRFLERRLP